MSLRKDARRAIRDAENQNEDGFRFRRVHHPPFSVIEHRILIIFIISDAENWLVTLVSNITD